MEILISEKDEEDDQRMKKKIMIKKIIQIKMQAISQIKNKIIKISQKIKTVLIQNMIFNQHEINEQA